jgi:Right handed beta helix region
MPASAAKAPQRCAKTTSVGTRLARVIASAAPGSVVCLTGGDYGDIAIRNIHKAKPVVVRPVKGSSASMDLELAASSGLRLVGLIIDGVVMSNSANITLSHNTFTGMSLVQTQRAHANILFDSNRLDGISAGPTNYEGRLTIRGYDNTQPVGVTISNNHFGGGCSDGVQVIGDAYGVRIGPGNKFTGLRQRGCVEHVDPIQLYGGPHVVVRGNYFHDNGDGTGGVESFDGDDYGTVTNNVFVCTCEYPYSVAASGGDNWVVEHNTFAGGGLVSFANANDGDSASGNVVRNNVFTNGRGISAPGSAWGTNDHNLNAGVPGRGNLRGKPVFVGGKKPKSYRGYRLARGSRGKGAASDGGDLGIRARR